MKELIPEFFYLSEFLLNRNGLELGVLANGSVIDHVEVRPCVWWID